MMNEWGTYPERLTNKIVKNLSVDILSLGQYILDGYYLDGSCIRSIRCRRSITTHGDQYVRLTLNGERHELLRVEVVYILRNSVPPLVDSVLMSHMRDNFYVTDNRLYYKSTNALVTCARMRISCKGKRFRFVVSDVVRELEG